MRKRLRIASTILKKENQPNKTLEPMRLRATFASDATSPAWLSLGVRLTHTAFAASAWPFARQKMRAIPSVSREVGEGMASVLLALSPKSRAYFGPAFVVLAKRVLLLGYFVSFEFYTSGEPVATAQCLCYVLWNRVTHWFGMADL